MEKKKKAATQAEAMVPAGVPVKPTEVKAIEPKPGEVVYGYGGWKPDPAPATDYVFLQGDTGPGPLEDGTVHVDVKAPSAVAEEPAPPSGPPKNPTYPKKPDYADLPFEVVVVERDPATLEVLHVEVVSRHTVEAIAMAHLRSANRAVVHRHRYTAELVRP
jgi:hypothetical protein